jgi:hypothetical protein
VTSWTTIQAVISADLSSRLERYRKRLDMSHSEVLVDALNDSGTSAPTVR